MDRLLVICPSGQLVAVENATSLLHGDKVGARRR